MQQYPFVSDIFYLYLQGAAILVLCARTSPLWLSNSTLYALTTFWFSFHLLRALLLVYFSKYLRVELLNNLS